MFTLFTPFTAAAVGDAPDSSFHSPVHASVNEVNEVNTPTGVNGSAPRNSSRKTPKKDNARTTARRGSPDDLAAGQPSRGKGQHARGYRTASVGKPAGSRLTWPNPPRSEGSGPGYPSVSGPLLRSCRSEALRRGDAVPAGALTQVARPLLQLQARPGCAQAPAPPLRSWPHEEILLVGEPDVPALTRSFDRGLPRHPTPHCVPLRLYEMAHAGVVGCSSSVRRGCVSGWADGGVMSGSLTGSRGPSNKEQVHV